MIIFRFFFSIALSIAAYVFVNILLQIPLYFWKEAGETDIQLSFSLINSLSVTASVLVFINCLYRRKLYSTLLSLGIIRISAKNALLAFSIGALSALAVCTFTIIIFGRNAFYGMGMPNSMLLASFILIPACILSPIWEEILFRGVLLQFLTKHLGNKLSVILTSIIFSLVHVSYDIYGKSIAFFLSLMLCTLAIKFKSTTPSVIAHASCNLVILTFSTTILAW